MRLVAVFFGFFLTLAAAIMAAQMMKSGEPFDLIAPCLLGGFGLGLFGFGLFFPVSFLQPDQCEPVDQADSTDTAEVDGD